MGELQKLTKKAENRWLRLARGARWVILVTAVILVALRLALPWMIKSYVNHQLAKVPDFSGRIGKVQVSLWRGAYTIRDIKIFKSEGGVPVPFFSAPSLDLSIQWRELFHGAVVGEVLLKQPEVNFVSGPTPEQSQTGINKPWGKTLESFFPFRINRLEIREGEVHFRDFFKSGPVDIYLTNLFAVATNLTNTRKSGQKLPAGCIADSRALGGGQLHVDLKMDPLDSAPTFELNASLTNVNMVDLNDFLRAYGKLDVERGDFSMFTSVASVQAKYDGYVKVMFDNLDVFAWEKERKKNILEIFWEAIAGALAVGLKNHPHDQLATQIPISGSFTSAHTDIWSSVGNLLHNAFIRALLPKIEPKVNLEDVKPKEP